MVCFGAYLTHVQTCGHGKKKCSNGVAKRDKTLYSYIARRKCRKTRGHLRPPFIPVFTYPRWCRISSINSMLTILVDWNLGSISQTTTTFPSSIFFDGRLVSIFFSAVFVLDSLGCFSEPSLGVWQRCVFFADRDVAIISCIQMENSSLT